MTGRRGRGGGDATRGSGRTGAGAWQQAALRVGSCALWYVRHSAPHCAPPPAMPGFRWHGWPQAASNPPPYIVEVHLVVQPRPRGLLLARTVNALQRAGGCRGVNQGQRRAHVAPTCEGGGAAAAAARMRPRALSAAAQQPCPTHTHPPTNTTPSHLALCGEVGPVHVEQHKRAVVCDNAAALAVQGVQLGPARASKGRRRARAVPQPRLCERAASRAARVSPGPRRTLSQGAAALRHAPGRAGAPSRYARCAAHLPPPARR